MRADRERAGEAPRLHLFGLCRWPPGRGLRRPPTARQAPARPPARTAFTALARASHPAAVALRLATEYEGIKKLPWAIDAYGLYLADMGLHVFKVSVLHFSLFLVGLAGAARCARVCGDRCRSPLLWARVTSFSHGQHLPLLLRAPAPGHVVFGSALA